MEILKYIATSQAISCVHVFQKLVARVPEATKPSSLRLTGIVIKSIFFLGGGGGGGERHSEVIYPAEI